MQKLEKDSVVVIDNQDIEINDILDKVVNIPADSMLSYFTVLGLMFPRRLRMDALKKVLSPYVNNERPHVTQLTDELLYRIRWFDTFSEAQLVNLLPVFEDGRLLDEYKEEFWLGIVSYMLEKKVSSDNINKLFDLAKSLENVPPLEKLDGIAYNDVLNPLFFDEENCIDGLTLEIFRPVVFKCSTLVEVREIGKKYGVNVPRRLRKQELVEIILDELRDRGKLTDEIEEKVNKMTVIPLQRFAMNNDIKVSIELKKEEIIEYILKNAHQTKALYFKPQAGAYKVYEREDFDLSDLDKIDEMIQEPEPEPEMVAVTFVNEDLETTLEIVKGEKVAKPADPEKEGYAFMGWYLDDKLYDFGLAVDAELRLVATYKLLGPEMVKVNFIAKGESNEVHIEKGHLVQEPKSPTKEGYEFIGWFLEDNLYDFEDPVYEDIELVAQWYELEPEKVTVTFIDGESAEEVELIKGEKVQPIRPPKKEDYKFSGWYLADELFDFNLPVNEDIILFAHWKEQDKEAVYGSVDLSEIIVEIRRVNQSVEDLKDAFYNTGKSDQLEDIDFSEKYGYEGAEEKGISIKQPYILMPNEIKISKRNFKKLKKRKQQKELEMERRAEIKRNQKSKYPPVPVIVVEEEKDEY